MRDARIITKDQAPITKSEETIVCVDWIDAAGVTSEWEFWTDLKLVHPAHARSVGILLEDVEEHVTLCMTASPKEVLGMFSIPRVAILDMRILAHGEGIRPFEPSETAERQK